MVVFIFLICSNTLYMIKDVISNVNTSDRTPAGISIDSAAYVDNVNVMKSNQCGFSVDPASEAGLDIEVLLR